MQSAKRSTAWGLAFPVLLLLASPAFADAPKCLGPYTLNSVNYAPSTDGDVVETWTGDFTINLAKSAGTMTVAVEAMLPGGDWASLGSMSTTAIAQFHGPLYKLRFNVSACSSCLATIVACAARD
jgi:hypothetical protein